jgi:putative protease
MALRAVPALLAPAGSLDAARAAVANGANAIYLGAGAFNARDADAQLSLDALGDACRIAHAAGVSIYLTLNTLIKPAELGPALTLLGDAIDRGIDAVIVQDVGLVDLIRAVYPALPIHGSTQMTVHDVAGAAMLHDMGVARVVLARENTIDDVRAIRAAVPGLELETFVHGALCIAYSGQCFMSGLIAERSANRGSCAQSCRKDYTLADGDTGETLDVGYLISAKDLAAVEHLAALAEAGVTSLKIEGRKKRPEYVATVTRSYRAFLDGLARGEAPGPVDTEAGPLVQIYSRGFTAGMLGGRGGRAYITRERPDAHGVPLGTVVGSGPGELLVQVTREIRVGDGLALEPPESQSGAAERDAARVGCTVTTVRTVSRRPGALRQAIGMRTRVPVGWRVIRSADAELLAGSRASYADVANVALAGTEIAVEVSGRAGSPVTTIWTAGPRSVTVASDVPLATAVQHPLDVAKLRAHLGRLGGTPYMLGPIGCSRLAEGLFLPVSELNRLRQRAVAALDAEREDIGGRALADRTDRITSAIRVVSRAAPGIAARVMADDRQPILSASVYRVDDARVAAAAGATEIVFDPFLRNPPPPAAHLRALVDELRPAGVGVRLRLPTIVRPGEYRPLVKWLDLGTPLMVGHVGLARTLAGEGRSVVLDYAANCFNAHTAARYFGFGIERIVLSVELTAAEMAGVTEPWAGAGFETVVFGRPEGMTIEHCVLSAAFDRKPATCRDLCVQAHPNVELTDPAGYTFAVATDSACRNRLLHSRPIEGSEYLGVLWRAGMRAYHLLFNVPGDPVGALVGSYAAQLASLAAGAAGAAIRPGPARELVGSAFTRGHFARAV